MDEDRELLCRFIGGDGTAFEALVLKYREELQELKDEYKFKVKFI